jgi:hypothetical protein
MHHALADGELACERLRGSKSLRYSGTKGLLGWLLVFAFVGAIPALLIADDRLFWALVGGASLLLRAAAYLSRASGDFAAARDSDRTAAALHAAEARKEAVVRPAESRQYDSPGEGDHDASSPHRAAPARAPSPNAGE